MARTVTSTLEIHQVYEQFATEMKKLVDFDRVTVDTIDQEAAIFSPEYSSGVELGGREVGKVVPIAGTAVECVFRTGRTLSREDIRAGDRFEYDSDRTDAGLRSHILVPLVARDRTLGLMSLQSRRSGAYGPKEQAILERLADQIAPAVENARLYDAVQQAHNELEPRIEARTEELTRANTSLRESEEQFRRLFEESPFGVALADEEYRIIKVNNAYCQMLGYSEEELSGLSLNDINHPDETEANEALFMKLFRGEIPSYQHEKRRITKAGETIWVRTTTGALRDENGKPLYVLGVVENITDRKLLREQLVQAQKMEVVGQLAGGVAHDFNNLLTPILGFSDLGMDELAADHPAWKYFEQVQGAAERGADVVRRLLLFSRRQIAQPKVVNLNDLVLNTERMLDRLLGEDIALTSSLAPDLGTVKVDPGQMEQVLFNLAINARDAMPGGGKLTIETASVTLDHGFSSDLS